MSSSALDILLISHIFDLSTSRVSADFTLKLKTYNYLKEDLVKWERELNARWADGERTHEWDRRTSKGL